MIDLQIITRRDCELCDEMKEVAADFAVSGEVALREVDVDSDPELVGRYGDEVPVLLINGRRAFKYRVDRRELRRRLAAERRRSAARRWLGRLAGQDGEE